MATDNGDAELLEALTFLVACGLIEFVDNPKCDEQRYRMDPHRLDQLRRMPRLRHAEPGPVG